MVTGILVAVAAAIQLAGGWHPGWAWLALGALLVAVGLVSRRAKPPA
jgi:hypothetical protein